MVNILQCWPNSKILGRLTDHPRWMARWPVLSLGISGRISQDLVKSRRHEMSIYSSPIVLKFYRRLRASAAKSPVNFQGDWSICPNYTQLSNGNKSVGNALVAKRTTQGTSMGCPFHSWVALWRKGDRLWTALLLVPIWPLKWLHRHEGDLSYLDILTDLIDIA